MTVVDPSGNAINIFGVRRDYSKLPAFNVFAAKEPTNIRLNQKKAQKARALPRRPGPQLYAKCRFGRTFRMFQPLKNVMNPRGTLLLKGDLYG
jgi:hypothetical protein